MPGTAPDATTADLRQLIYEMLIDKVREDRFPSSTMMDMIEDGMDDELKDQYIRALAYKVATEQFPSVSMMQRILALL